MRIRRKKWARKELDNSKFYIDRPEDGLINTWRSKFTNPNNPLFVELGCGKGNFISKLASSNLDINYIAVDMIEAMLGLSKRNIEDEYSNLDFNSNIIKTYDKQNKKYKYSQEVSVPNLWLIRANCEYINKIFGEQDKIDRIYINFCNPWPRDKHNKRRLTHPRQLEQYKTFLAKEGEIFFKTDDDELFSDSLEYFASEGFTILEKTYDLHNEDIFAKYEKSIYNSDYTNIQTEHEKMFTQDGIKIKALIAKI